MTGKASLTTRALPRPLICYQTHHNTFALSLSWLMTLQLIIRVSSVHHPSSTLLLPCCVTLDDITRSMERRTCPFFFPPNSHPRDHAAMSDNNNTAPWNLNWTPADGAPPLPCYLFFILQMFKRLLKYIYGVIFNYTVLVARCNIILFSCSP